MRVRSSLVLLLLLAAPVAATHNPCPPEDCPELTSPIPGPILSGTLTFTQLDVDIDAVDGLAVTGMAFSFANPANVSADMRLRLPIPGPLVSVNLTVGDKFLEGTVQERQAAQTTYNEATAAGRSAVLIAYDSPGLVQLDINLPGASTGTLRLAYAQSVARAAGEFVYRLPLSGLGVAPETARIDFSAADRDTIVGLRFPALALEAIGTTQGTFQGDLPAGKDVVAVWGDANSAVESTLILAKTPGQEGTALAVLCAGTQEVLVRDVVFVLDTSGSMEGTKIVAAREALRAELGRLSPLDRYDVVAFDSHVENYRNGLSEPTSSAIAADQQRVGAELADGGTDIDGGLQEALRILADGEGTLPMVVFLTDGLPSAGVTDHDQIIERFRAANTRHAVIEVVPIGLDADHTFLADLALRSGGLYLPVTGNDPLLQGRLERILDVVAHAQLADVRVTADNLDVLLDAPGVAYEDGCLRVGLSGEFPATGDVAVTLTGRGAQGAVVQTFTFSMATTPVHAAAASLWGEAYIAHLLSEERVENLNHRIAIIDAAVEHRQLSPYTSWIIADLETATVPRESAVAYGPNPTATASGSSHSAPSMASTTYSSPAGADSAFRDEETGKTDATTTPGFDVTLLIAAVLGIALAARRRPRP